MIYILEKKKNILCALAALQINRSFFFNKNMMCVRTCCNVPNIINNNHDIHIAIKADLTH